MEFDTFSITGVLLAAGYSRRFSGDKLLHPLADGTPIAVAAARKLYTSVNQALAVVRPESTELAHLLRCEGLQIVNCVEAETGMGASLACGVKASLNAQAWVIALADMPFIQIATIEQIATLLRQRAAIVAPQYQGQRGHPIGFSQFYGTQLSQLSGDTGARTVLQQHHTQITHFPCNDAGIHYDIDTYQDFKCKAAL
ncbi:nucleotidyltransferase family protein [Candidatus Parabeggiatoa sp. HSG14]|uniref:nucleotidyltransferase family protein n=1 Tax=Candidatus Parabeggiatoa sp. HSG14 TaxID=3055593 RepID=UPI0025A7704D|nr:nucleotidyltransferase family protein [Thiotrichales bacterium HSG14]